MNDIVVKAAGYDFPYWDDLDAVATMEAVSGRFQCSVTYPLDGVPDGLKYLQNDEPVVLTLGGEDVITGYIMEALPEHSKDEFKLTIVGQDKTVDLVECSVLHDSGVWEKVKLDRICRDICQPLGVQVVAAVDVGEAFEKFQLETNETALAALTRAAGYRGILLNTDGKGRLVLTRESGKRLETPFQLGVNIEEGSGALRSHGRYSQHIVRGQSDKQSIGASKRSELELKVLDKGMRRHRPIIHEMAGDLDEQKMLRWGEYMRNRSVGAAYRWTLKYPSWQHDGKLLRPNRVARVQNPLIGADGDKLLTAVGYHFSKKQGYFARPTFAPVGAFDIVPIPESQGGPL